jgi:hypothetical protein
MNSQNDSPQILPLRLSIRGSVPSFKNRKRNGGRTEKKTRQRMNEIIADLASQLASEYRIACKTRTALSPESWIACVMPADDSLKHIREIHLTANLSLPGEEITTIEIL